MNSLIVEIITLLLLGGLGGLLAGLLGIGGGIIYVLIFSYYLPIAGVPVEWIVPAIVANSMFSIFFAGISGSYKQWKNNNFHPKEIIYIGLAATFASILFSYIISTGTWYTPQRFTFFFIALLLFIAFRLFKGKSKKEIILEKPNKPLHYYFTGLTSGTIAAFSGVGGGVIIVPILTDMLNIPIKKATSISLGVISVMAFFTSVYNLFFHQTFNSFEAPHLGLIIFSVSIPVAIGSLIFSPIGVSISSKLKPSTLRTIFVIFVLVVITKMIYGII